MTILRKPVEFIVMKFSPNDIQRQIANAHSLFNIANVIIQLPFAGLLVKAANKLVPGDEQELETGIKYLDPRIIETPSIAVGQAKKEVLRMGNLVENNLLLASKALKIIKMKN